MPSLGPSPQSTIDPASRRASFSPSDQSANSTATSRVGPSLTSEPKTGTVMMRPAGGGPSITVEPCECALETGGFCSQAVLYGPDGDITEIWCVDDGCGFCVGGISPKGAGFTMRVALGR
jgi:hypothetical protein